MIARIITVLCLLALMAPAAAPAQGPFSPIPPAPQPQATAPPEEEDDDEEGLTSTQQLLIGLSGIVLLGGIAWAILRDARSAAPVLRRGRDDEDVHRPKGSQKPAGVRHRQSRAKAKAARQARKKARKR